MIGVKPSLSNAICFEYGIFKRELKSSRLERELTPTLRAKMGDNLPVVMCLNPHDSQTERVFSTEDAFHSVAANNGGGQARDGVFIKCFQQNTRDEVRFINNDGLIAGALPASPGAKQQNYILERKTQVSNPTLKQLGLW